jgi:hypothetical protein
MVTKRRRTKVLRKRMAIHSLIFLTRLRCTHIGPGVYFV